MYQISFYVPVDSSQRVKCAMFSAGAGRIGNYEQCSFESNGVGQFFPTSGAHPFLGEVGILEELHELKVEMVCDKNIIKEVVAAMKKAHPYETPAYHVFEILNF